MRPNNRPGKTRQETDTKRNKTTQQELSQHQNKKEETSTLTNFFNLQYPSLFVLVLLTAIKIFSDQLCFSLVGGQACVWNSVDLSVVCFYDVLASG